MKQNTRLSHYLPENVLIIVGIWFFWHLFISIIGAIAPVFLPFTNTFSNYAIQESAQMPKWIEQWSNFDGGAYLVISHSGYKAAGLLQAYFPLYPMTIKIISECILFFFSQLNRLAVHMLVGMIISASTSLGFSLFLVKYIEEKFSSSLAMKCLLILFFFPSAFFFHAVYTESLFLCLIFLSFLLYTRKKWVLLSFAIMAASATRIVGIFLVPAFFFDMLIQNNNVSISLNMVGIVKKLRENWVSLSLISLGSLGLVAYMTYLLLNFHDPLLFFHVQSQFGAGRETRIILLPQVVWRYIKIFTTVRPFDWKYYTYIQEFVASMSVLLLLSIGYIKRKKYGITIAEIIFSACCFLLPTLTGNFSSMTRYVLVCFPFLYVVGFFFEKHKKIAIFFYLLSLALLILNTILFIQGRWVA